MYVFVSQRNESGFTLCDMESLERGVLRGNLISHFDKIPLAAPLRKNCSAQRLRQRELVESYYNNSDQSLF